MRLERLERQTQPQRVSHPYDGGERGVTFTRQGFVHAFAGKAGIARELELQLTHIRVLA